MGLPELSTIAPHTSYSVSHRIQSEINVYNNVKLPHMRKFILFLFFCLVFTTTFSQNNTYSKAEYPKVVPPSPEAAALGKYGDIPVSLFTGSPNISIPIYEFKNGDITIPISLNYDASGIKVDQIATNVGLGWSLFAGGLVTETIRGGRDGVGSGSIPANFNPYMYPANAINFGWTVDYELAKTAIYNNSDTERDLYIYNFLGHTGKFVADTNGVFRCIPGDPTLKIDPPTVSLNAWVITDDKGFRYYFSALEGSSDSSACIAGNGSQRVFDNASPTSYYITKIESPTHRTAYFEYESYTYKIVRSYNEVDYRRDHIVDGCSDLAPTMNRKCNVITTYGGLRIKKISCSNLPLSVLFAYSSTHRLDLPYNGQDQGNYLESIKMYYQNDLKKQWDFSYDYFGSGAARRLKLLTAKEDSKPAYRFYYDEVNPLPARMSFSQDHWGYYNGKSNTTFTPPVALIGRSTGADRNPDSVYMQSGSLNRIIYPTGGRSVFEYEPHTDRVTENIITYVKDTATVQFGSSIGDEVVPFYLDSGATDVTISWNLSPYNYDDYVTGYITDGADENTLYKSMVNNSAYEQDISGQLTTAHSYKLKISRTNPGDVGYITLTWTAPVVTTVTHDKIVLGGLRIKSIKNYSDSLQLASTKQYRYNWLNDTLRSSIVMPAGSDIFYNTSYQTLNSNPESGICGYNVVSSSTVPLIGNGIDNMFGYRQVVEFNSSNNLNGRTIYKYSAGAGDLNITSQFSFNGDWCMGHLLEKTDQKYNVSTSGFENVHKQVNQYGSPFGPYCSVNGDSCRANQYFMYDYRLSIAKPEVSFQTPLGPFAYPAEFNVEKYHTISAVVQLLKTEDITYGPDGTDSLKTVSNYYYDDPHHNFPTKVDFVNSKNQLVRKENKYAFDFASSGSPNIYNEMVDQNIVSPVIQETTSNVSLSAELAKKKTAYLKWHDRFILPYQTLSSLNGATLQADLSINLYDTTGNIKQFTGRENVATSFLWDYHLGYPIAQVIGADSASIAYTSFEADGSGNWSGVSAVYVDSATRGVTGQRYYNQSGFSFSKPLLSSSAYYSVTYWSKNGSYSVSGTQTGYPHTLNTVTIGSNTWTLYEHLVTGQSTITVSGSGAVDELRLHPQTAMMTTYTYMPLVGIGSQCDPSNHIMYYEYDDFGRLKAVRDQHNNILKKNDYRYASQ